MSRLLIVLGAFNGNRLIQQQIESIRKQDYSYWSVLVRDDGSSDDTVALVESIADRDVRIKIISDSLGNLGAAGNFGALMQHAFESGADYVMFADQDDVWLPNKISDQMALMECMEKEAPDIPILVHSDLEVVDEKLNQIHPSLMRYQGIHHIDHHPLQSLLVQNFVTGCTCLANRALMELALPIPQDAMVHDWWLALCAAASGRIAFLPAATVQYRQHAKNVIAAKSFREMFNPLHPSWFRRLKLGINHLRGSFIQARSFCHRLEERRASDPEVLNLVHGYASLPQLPPWQRIQRIRTLGIHKQDVIRQWLLYLHLLLLRC